MHPVISDVAHRSTDTEPLEDLGGLALVQFCLKNGSWVTLSMRAQLLGVRMSRGKKMEQSVRQSMPFNAKQPDIKLHRKPYSSYPSGL